MLNTTYFTLKHGLQDLQLLSELEMVLFIFAFGWSTHTDFKEHYIYICCMQDNLNQILKLIFFSGFTGEATRIQFNLFNPSQFLNLTFFYNSGLEKATWMSILKCMFEEFAFKLQNSEPNKF